MATVLSPNSFFSGVTATDRLTRSKKLMMTPTPSNTAIRQRRLVQKVKDGESLLNLARKFRDSRTQPTEFEFFRVVSVRGLHLKPALMPAANWAVPATARTHTRK